MKRQTLLLLCLLLVAPAARSQDTARNVPDMGDGPAFYWLMRPYMLPYDLFYPEAANDQNVVGRVGLECAVRADQHADCVVSSETPTGWGFGDAAVGISRSFRMQPNMRDGHVIGAPHGHLNLSFSPYPSGETSAGGLDLPAWEAAPSADAVSAAWPEGKAHPNARGRAVLSCTVDASRALNCSLVRETEAGLGLGHAAMALAPQFRVAESETEFLQRHHDAPFLLPVNFGLAPEQEPLNRFTAGETPIEVPQPPAQIVQQIYPQAARDAHISGSAVVTCTMHTTVSASCVITSETPSGAGFGAAALMMANAIVTTLGTLPGGWSESMPGDQFSIRVPFELPPQTQ